MFLLFVSICLPKAITIDAQFGFQWAFLWKLISYQTWNLIGFSNGAIGDPSFFLPIDAGYADGHHQLFWGTQLALRAALSVPHKWRYSLQIIAFAVGINKEY
jgi:hypothetical protein